jgi:hypothetical protein
MYSSIIRLQISKFIHVFQRRAAGEKEKKEARKAVKRWRAWGAGGAAQNKEPS